jgi:hypothetical protein
VRYPPDWEPLADALKRVVAAGLAEDDAKIDLCRAIGDGKIRIRVLMEKNAPNVGGETLQHGNVDVPPRLGPADFDWVKSRPLAHWNTGPDPRNPAERYHAMWPSRPRSIELIELWTADVVKFLCGDDDADDDASGTSPATARHETTAIKALASARALAENPDATRDIYAERCACGAALEEADQELARAWDHDGRRVRQVRRRRHGKMGQGDPGRAHQALAR